MTQSHPSAPQSRTTFGSRTLGRFRRDEDGSIILFSLFLFLLMVLIGGMAVDLMRFETRRVHVQNTLDSAILAAADLDQSLDPEQVIRDYFQKAGYDPSMVDIVNDSTFLGGQELVGRSLTASTRINVPTIFMHMLDVPLLSAPVASAARENIQNVEISLVLDISGSMRWGPVENVLTSPNRITELRKAVRSFARAVLQVTCETDAAGVETCVQPPTTASTTINIIPYAGHVNPGRDVFDILGGSRWHNWSSCKEVTNADFRHADLPRASSHQLPHHQHWAIDRNWLNWGWCPTDSASILYAENDYRVIDNFIQNVKLHDGTATHVGMKYGVALLNPSSRPVFDELARRGVIDPAYRNRPADFEDDVVKYIILMTDGQTTDQFRPRVPDDGRTDSSSSRRDWNYNDIYSAFTPPSGGLHTNPSLVLTGDGIPNGVPTGVTVPDRLGDILDRFGSVNRDLNVRPASEVEQGFPSFTTYFESGIPHNAAQNNRNITAQCNLAKESLIGPGGEVLKRNRITVFTISFFAPDGARRLMEDCASSPAHHFRIQNLNIESAFQAIAQTINQLRLTL